MPDTGVASPPRRRWPLGDIPTWGVVVTTGLVLTYVAVRLDLPVGTASPPFTGAFRSKLEIGSVLAPVVAAVVLSLVRRTWLLRLSWPQLLGLCYLGALAWSLALASVDGGYGLAAPMDHPDEYLADVGAVAGHPLAFVDGFVEHAPTYSTATRTHPPGPVLMLWLLGRLGLTHPEPLGLLITAIGCLTVPLVAVSVRSLCHEVAARRLLPVLVLAPYAVWVAVSMDAVTMTLCAAAVTCGVIGSEHHRRGWSQSGWATAAGLLMGLASLFSYSAGWMAATVIMVYFVRRRPLLNTVTAVAGLLPLLLFRAWGFPWNDGLTAAQVDASLRIGPERSWLLWGFLDVLLLLIACGPALVTAARGLRRTPGWPFVVGALLAVGFAVGSGLSRGEVERSWLPFFPWLLVPAVAPLVRPDPGDRGEATAGPLPWWQAAVGAGAAVVVQAILRTRW